LSRIDSAVYVSSCTGISKCPKPDKPEFAFIGRSNVGKSSLINMLTGRNKLAKTSVQPGKTRTINHFIINNSWFMADLPGYGYAKVSKTEREKFSKFITEYLTKRDNLMCLFVLLDSRHGPMPVDMDFMERLGIDGVPFARVFTKSDKLSESAFGKNLELHNNEMLKVWESLPHTFITSARNGTGREEVLSFIEETLTLYQQSG
jgi:GTP-binding protein